MTISNAALDEAILERESGAGILAGVEQFLGRFVAYPSDHARVAHTLWCAHTHLADACFTTPRLAFMSAEKMSGKSRALEASAQLVRGPMLWGGPSSAALVRTIAGGNCTILFDEIDELFGSAGREDANVDTRTILNIGYRRGAKVPRCVLKGKGKVEVEMLDAFAPVALAGLRTLPDMLASRCIFIRMQRRAPDEYVESFRVRKIRPDADRVRQALENWCSSIEADVADADPEMPDGIIDRNAECWEPLLAVADAAAGDWPRRARDAAMYLTIGAQDDTTSRGVELLAHIRDAFGSDDKLFTKTLTRRLCDRDESPWKDIRGKELDDTGLANRLRPYRSIGVQSKGVKIDGETKKGYRKEDFHEAWRRYLPPYEDGVTAVTGVTKLINKSKKVTPVTPVTPNPKETEKANGQSEGGDGPDCDGAPPAGLEGARRRLAGHAGGRSQVGFLSDADDALPDVGEGAPSQHQEPSRRGLSFVRCCTHCGGLHSPDNPVLECYFGAQEVWLHRACQTPWAEARR